MTDAVSVKEPAQQTKQASLLIVDDDEDIRVTLRDVFQLEGYTVATAGSIKQAKTALKKQSFDVAIVDLRLGDEDGMDLVQHLTDCDGSCSVIVLTGYGSMESAQEALRRQAYEFLTKPSDIQDLKSSVARASERTSLLHSLQARVAELDEAHRQLQELSAQREEALEAQVQERTRELTAANEAMREEMHRREQAEATVLMLSTPVLRIRERLLLLPLIGEFDEERAHTMKVQLLQRVSEQRAHALVLDCTGLVGITPAVADELARTIEAVELLGASVVMSGLSTETSRSLIGTSLPTNRVRYVNDLEHGIDIATRLLNAGSRVPEPL